MPISLTRNNELGLCLNRFTGAITAPEVRDFMRFHSSDPLLATSDLLQVFEQDADLSAISAEELDHLRDFLRDLLAPIEFQLVRRSAFVCRSPMALQEVTYWLRGRDQRDGIKTDPRLCDTLEEACAWLLLGPGESAIVAAERGFVELARFDAARSAP